MINGTNQCICLKIFSFRLNNIPFLMTLNGMNVLIKFKAYTTLNCQFIKRSGNGAHAFLRKKSTGILFQVWNHAVKATHLKRTGAVVCPKAVKNLHQPGFF